MSEVKWCDTGHHPFAWGKDNDESEYAETRERQGRRRILHACGNCNRKSDEAIAATDLGATVAKPKALNGE